MTELGKAAAVAAEEIVAEKIIPLADPARNGPRDLNDLWCLTANQGIELDHLADVTRQKLEFRERPFGDLQDAILGKEARLKALWPRRLAYQMSILPPFDEVFRGLRRTLRRSIPLSCSSRITRPPAASWRTSAGGRHSLDLS